MDSCREVYDANIIKSGIDNSHFIVLHRFLSEFSGLIMGSLAFASNSSFYYWMRMVYLK
jgi:hypothetical protein